MNIDNPQKITLCYWTSDHEIDFSLGDVEIKSFDGISFPVEELRKINIEETATIYAEPAEIFWAASKCCIDVTDRSLKTWKANNNHQLPWKTTNGLTCEFRIIKNLELVECIDKLKGTEQSNWFIGFDVIGGDPGVFGYIFFSELELAEIRKVSERCWRNIKGAVGACESIYSKIRQDVLSICEYEPIKASDVFGESRTGGNSLPDKETESESSITEEPSADDETAEAGAGGDPADQTLSDIQERAQALILQAVKPCLQYLGDKKKREDYWQGRKDLNGANLGQICLEQGRIIEGDNTYFTIKEGRCGYCSRGVWVQYGGAGKQYYILRRDAIEDELRKILKKVCNSLPLKNKK